MKANLSVTAADTTCNEGEENPDFELVYDGFQYDDDPDELDVLPEASTDADAASPAGTYDIIVSGGEDNNYSFSYTSGTLTVTEITGIGNAGSDRFNVYPNPAS